MSKQFVCKIDNKSFNTQEELVQHLLDTYSFEDNNQGETALIVSKLEESFPFAIISVSELEKDNRYGDFHIHMSWKEYEADFSFYIGESSENSYYDYHFSTLEEAISHYSFFIEKKDEITKLLSEHYNPDSIKIEQMYDGDYHHSGGILFVISVGEQTYHQHYLFEKTVEQFVQSFKAHFDFVVEGDVSIDSDYSTGDLLEYFVNDVPVSTLLKRAKKIKIEILEEK